jgi:hypothetical protein
LLIIAAVLLGGGLLFYSQTFAFTNDEGFHLLAAQLIDKGRRPYIDFFFPQTPLNTYWNALWMKWLGQTWRVPHAIAALLVMGAAVLAAQFVWERMPASEKWRAAAALAAMLMIVSNVMVLEYGPLGQAYAICLFLVMLAFRLTVLAVDRTSPFWALGMGLCAGAAAASSLLTATAAPVYILWLLFYNRAGNRWVKAVAYVVGCAIPFWPVLRLLAISARPVIFNLFEYHLFFRKIYWEETTQHDLEIMTLWIDSGQVLLLLLLAMAGLLYIYFRGGWARELRREFYLCLWLTLSMSLEIGTAHPTFSRYFLLVVPFVAILAAVGLYTVSERLYRPEAPYAALLLLALLFALGLGKSLYERSHDVRTWSVYQQLAKKVDAVTPRGAPIYGDEETYFLTQRTPPSGLEFGYSHRLKLAPGLAAQLHIITDDQVSGMMAGGSFAAVETCDDDNVDDWHLNDIYIHKFNADDCYVFWGRGRK